MSSTFSDTSFDDKKRALWPFVKRIFVIAMKHKQYFWLLAGLTLICAVLEALIPLVWQSYIDEWITPAVEASKAGETVMTEGFWRYAGYYVALFLGVAASVAGFVLAAGRLQELVIYDLRNEMFARLQRLSYSFYDQNSIGHLSIRLTSDVTKVSRIVAWGLIDVLFGVFLIITSLIGMFSFNWKLSLVVLLTIPALLFLAIRVRMLLITYARRARKAYSEMAAYLTEHINGVEVNKATVQEGRVSRQFEEVTEKFRFASTRGAYFASLYHPIVVMCGSVAAALVIYMGGHLTLSAVGGISVGVLAAFFSYSRMIFDPIFDITRYYASMQDSLSAGERIFSLIDAPIDIKDEAHVSEAYGIIRGDIRFEKVDFHYTPEKPILQAFDLHIPAGQSVALVGATGSGKTTISNLVARFYEPKSGKVRIDGISLHDRTLESYRKQLGVILQTPHLFSGTIRENLKYGKLDATDQEIRHALSTIGATQFVDRLDDQVGEEGNSLSLGEKQLLSFARALLKNPRILIMDEATSSVDTLAELQIQRGVEQMIQGRTAIIIAHRLSTIRNCDRILVIEGGKIVEDGSHAELMNAKGHYHHLYMGLGRAAS